MKIKLGCGAANMAEVASFCGGELYDLGGGKGGATFSCVCTDSREADENTLFIATRGERVDGHDYIASAMDLGCRCILCERIPEGIDYACAAFVVVKNSMEAFSSVGAGYRESFPLNTVAITGSVGKTTTKELCAAILKRCTKLYYTKGNFNSIIGMPMSLMEAGAECDTAIFEMGMSGLGEIRSMTKTARPRVAMVTNVGSSHLEYLGTRENIARAKLEIAEGICEGGYLLLNGDEPLLKRIKPQGEGKYTTLYVSIDGEGDAIASNVRTSGDSTYFDLEFGGRRICDLKISLLGKAFVYNAAFAAIGALLCGADEDGVREGLASYRPEGLRQNISRKNGVTVIMDCYNAAPESMRSAIDTLCALEVAGRRIAVLGDMRELGEGSDELHRGVGDYLRLCGAEALFTLGESGALIAQAAAQAGMAEECVFSFIDTEDADKLADLLLSYIKEGDAVLFKASRSLKLERVAQKVFG
ncbi:MAG: UDP-N-acetylmuramoyl-tripeptide--D-alanyl-D-alanine ligase [Clostridia bacterium]|nr:UDP-N-acetylmuramoyl-tripeptide--D-alanyl-D-alanine ligase [Clostridia bacterium]